MPRRSVAQGNDFRPSRNHPNREALDRIYERKAFDYKESERVRVNNEYYSNLGPSMGGDLALPSVPRAPIYVPFGKADPRRQPDAQAIREAQARDYLDQLTEDMRDRFTMNKMMNRVLDVGLSYAVPATLENTFDLIEGAWGMLVRQNTLLQVPKYVGPWVLEGVCNNPPGAGRSFIYGSYPGTYANSCLGGQVATPEVSTLEQVPDGHSAASWAWFNSLERYTHLLTYKRDIRNSTVLRNVVHAQPKTGFYRNPNAMRLANVTPQPVSFADIAAAASPVGAIATQVARVVQVAYGGATPPRLPPTLIATKSKPPPIGTKEKKGLARRIGVIGAKILDFTSETGDLIDAIYRALPQDVRDRWDRPNRRGDQHGQYGISGMDWKLQAIWHNLHRLDINQAVQNIALNELEDRAIGHAMAARNRAIRPGRFGSNVNKELRRRRKRRRR